jgi:hypothetical protein
MRLPAWQTTPGRVSVHISAALLTSLPLNPSLLRAMHTSATHLRDDSITLTESRIICACPQAQLVFKALPYTHVKFAALSLLTSLIVRVARQHAILAQGPQPTASASAGRCTSIAPSLRDSEVHPSLRQHPRGLTCVGK